MRSESVVSISSLIVEAATHSPVRFDSSGSASSPYYLSILQIAEPRHPITVVMEIQMGVDSKSKCLLLVAAPASWPVLLLRCRLVVLLHHTKVPYYEYYERLLYSVF